MILKNRIVQGMARTKLLLTGRCRLNRGSSEVEQSEARDNTADRSMVRFHSSVFRHSLFWTCF